MIRFSCGTCNHLLRTPAKLAGKKGKCARCGAVNLVPEALAVEVSRAPGPSPFRSTADLEAGGAIEGARYLTTVPDAARFSDVIEEIDPSEDAPPQPAPIARIGVAQNALERLSTRANPHVIPFDPQPAQVGRRAIFGALVVGAVLGFCLGVIASKWIF